MLQIVFNYGINILGNNSFNILNIDNLYIIYALTGFN